MDPGRHVSLARLEGFYWVARTGGYAKAARAFPYPITQPAVHQQVKKLEGELGVVLFERVGKEQMQLSASGARLYEFVAPFFEGLPAVLRSVRGGDYAGVLRILSAPMLVRRLLPAWLERLRAERPGVEVELREMAPPDIGLLRRGEVDLLVDYLPEVPDDLASMRVGVVRPCLVVPAGHPAAAGRARAPFGRDLRRLPARPPAARAPEPRPGRARHRPRRAPHGRLGRVDPLLRRPGPGLLDRAGARRAGARRRRGRPRARARAPGDGLRRARRLAQGHARQPAARRGALHGARAGPLKTRQRRVFNVPSKAVAGLSKNAERSSTTG